MNSNETTPTVHLNPPVSRGHFIIANPSTFAQSFGYSWYRSYTSQRTYCKRSPLRARIEPRPGTVLPPPPSSSQLENGLPMETAGVQIMELPANKGFEDKDYIVVGIWDPTLRAPTEKLLPLLHSDQEELFKQIHAAANALRPFYRRTFSLKSVSGFSIYQCSPRSGYHTVPTIHPETKRELALLFVDYNQSSHDLSSRTDSGVDWVGWIRDEFNRGSKNPVDGELSLELQLHWSSGKILIWGLLWLCVSLAFGVAYLTPNRGGGESEAVLLQTAGTISSYIVAVAAFLLALMAAVSEFSGA